jgi:hypothetical protein
VGEVERGGKARADGGGAGEVPGDLPGVQALLESGEEQVPDLRLREDDVGMGDEALPDKQVVTGMEARPRMTQIDADLEQKN